MMNQTLQDLKTRRSCRRYRPEQIKESELEQILEAGVFAPTGMGMQSPKIVVVQDKETIEELSKMNAKIMGVTSDPFYGAPTVLIVLADKNRNTYLEDGSLVMGNLMNAAHAVGVASCWIHRAKLTVRKNAIEAVKEARAHGDLSENFEYHAAKKDKNMNESRIRYLERMLKNAEIVSDQSKSDEVGINNTVTLYMEDDDEEETYKIVTSIRGNSMKGHISTESPMGKALLGHKVGERVYIKVNENFGYYAVIRKIENTDDGGDEIRKF